MRRQGWCLGAIIVGVATITSACGARTSLFDPETVVDASPPIDGPPDVGLPDVPTQACNPLPNPAVPFASFVCTAEAQQRCQAWAQSLTTTGYAHATCAAMKPCMMGDKCWVDNTNHVTCGCGDGFACGEGEVCIGETADGKAHCAKMCVSICALGCTSEACLCQTTPDDVCSASGKVCNQSGSGGPTCATTCPDH